MEPNKDLQSTQDIPVDNSITFELKSLITADKAHITDIAKSIVEQVSRGELDPVRSFGHAKKILEIATLLVENIRPYMADHVHVSKGESVVYDNIEYTQAETGVKYDYSSSKDLIYDEIMIRFKSVEKEKKEREAYLKTVKKDTGAFDPETSESWIIKPPVKSGQLSVKSELK